MTSIVARNALQVGVWLLLGLGCVMDAAVLTRLHKVGVASNENSATACNHECETADMILKIDQAH